MKRPRILARALAVVGVVCAATYIVIASGPRVRLVGPAGNDVWISSRPVVRDLTTMGTCSFATIVASERDWWSADGSLAASMTLAQQGVELRSCTIGENCYAVVLIHSHVGTMPYEAAGGEVNVEREAGRTKLSGSLRLEMTYNRQGKSKLEFEGIELMRTAEPPGEVVHPAGMLEHMPEIVQRWKAVCQFSQADVPLLEKD